MRKKTKNINPKVDKQSKCFGDFFYGEVNIAEKFRNILNE